mmetsp:Transcript_103914/g.294406  ORF Transcript_103914/g.294406 Transcript_103914/m.294406 type:complete len:238 (-) Transcript_103914:958-1671(-)
MLPAPLLPMHVEALVLRLILELGAEHECDRGVRGHPRDLKGALVRRRRCGRPRCDEGRTFDPPTAAQLEDTVVGAPVHPRRPMPQVVCEVGRRERAGRGQVQALTASPARQPLERLGDVGADERPRDAAHRDAAPRANLEGVLVEGRLPGAASRLVLVDRCVLQGANPCGWRAGMEDQQVAAAHVHKRLQRCTHPRATRHTALIWGSRSLWGRQCLLQVLKQTYHHGTTKFVAGADV